MNRAESAIQRLVSDESKVALAIISCFLLLAGCASPPTTVRRPVVSPDARPEAVPSPDETEAATTSGTPAITFEETIHNFGEIGAQSTHVCEFRFKNTGTATLKVREKIDSTCGCTVPVLSKTDYAPSEEGVIKVTYSAPTSPGPAAKSLVVHSNDPRNGGQVKLSIKATVVERVAYEPRRLSLRLKGPDAGCPPVTLRSLDQKSFSVTRIVSSSGGIKADCDPSLEATEFTFQPTLDLEKLGKYPAGSFVLTLTHPECKVIRIPYQALTEFQFSPPSVMLFNAEPNHPVLREVWLSSNYGEDFEIASWTSSLNLAEIVEKEKISSPEKASFRYRLRLSIRPPAQSDRHSLRDTLALHLTNGSTLQLPCSVFCTEPRGPRPEVRVPGR